MGRFRQEHPPCGSVPQVMKTRLEADEVAAQLERCDKENKMLKDEMNKEIEAVLALPGPPYPPPPPSPPALLLPRPSHCLIWLTSN